MVENHFPAPARAFLDNNVQSSSQPTSSQDGPSQSKMRNSTLKRRVLAGLELRRSTKKPRVIYSDDSDEEVEDTKPVKTSKSAKSVKKPSVIYSDSESDEEMVEQKRPVKTKKSTRLRKRLESSSDSEKSDMGETPATEKEASDGDSSGKFSSFDGNFLLNRTNFRKIYLN